MPLGWGKPVRAGVAARRRESIRRELPGADLLMTSSQPLRRPSSASGAILGRSRSVRVVGLNDTMRRVRRRLVPDPRDKLGIATARILGRRLARWGTGPQATHP